MKIVTEKDNFDKHFEKGKFSMSPDFNICIMAKHEGENAFYNFVEAIPNFMEFRRLAIMDDFKPPWK